MGNPAVPLVREVRPPERQVVLAIETAPERRRKSEVAEREVLGARNLDPCGDFVVEREIRRCRHHLSPALRVELGDMLAHTSHVFGRDGLECAAALAQVVEREVVALAKVIADPESPEFVHEGPREAVRRRRVDAGGVDALLLREAAEVAQLLAALPELERVAEALFGTQLYGARRIERAGLPVGEAEPAAEHSADRRVDARAKVQPRVFGDRDLLTGAAWRCQEKNECGRRRQADKTLSAIFQFHLLIVSNLGELHNLRSFQAVPCLQCKNAPHAQNVQNFCIHCRQRTTHDAADAQRHSTTNAISQGRFSSRPTGSGGGRACPAWSDGPSRATRRRDTRPRFPRL